MEEKHVEVQEYEKPEIADYGDLRELTERGINGNHLDGTFHHSHTITFIFSFR